MSVSATAVTHSAHTPVMQGRVFAREIRRIYFDLHCDP